MAYNHISLIAQNLEKLDWLTDDWVTTFVGKNAIKRARKQVASHTARQFGVLSGSRGLKRISCSTVAEGEDLRYLAQVTVTKDELTDSKCDCSKKPADGQKCDHIATLLVITSIFKNHFKKQPLWTKPKVDESTDLENLTEEQRALGVGLTWAYHMFSYTIGADVEMPYEDPENGGVPHDNQGIPGHYPTDMKQQRRKRSAYSMNKKRALLHAASSDIGEGGIGRWALDHFSPELLAKLLGERRSTLLSKICQHISEDEIVAFECGMQEEIEGFDDRVEEVERLTLEESRAKKIKPMDNGGLMEHHEEEQ